MRARVPLLSAALVVALTATAPGSAAACSVATVERPPGFDPVLNGFNAADIAITGRVTRVRYLEPGLGDVMTSRDYEATIRISRVYKGKTGPALRVTSTTSGAECGLGRLHVDQRLGFLLYEKRSPFAVTFLNRIRYDELERVTGGRSHRPGRR